MRIFATAAFVLLLAASASAGELSVSPATLDSMGLARMQPISDADGLTVRGKGLYEQFFNGTVPNWFNNTFEHFGGLAGGGFDPQSLGNPMISSAQSLVDMFDLSSFTGLFSFSF